MPQEKSYSRLESVYPELLNPKLATDYLRIQEMLDNLSINVVDEIESQVSDLIKSKHPEVQLSKSEIETLVGDFFQEHDKSTYGNWVFYPWKNTLVHILPEDQFIRVRTLRNNYKITPGEQAELSTKKVGIVGLSVGQSVAYAMALERSFGELRLADFDTLELSNLNRLKAGVTSLGLEKVVLAAREISEIDPYLKLTVFREGVNETNVDAFLLEGGKLDLIIDECDSLDIKVLLREKGKELQIPVIMETSDRGMLDIERFEKDPTLEIFHGYLKGLDRKDLKDLPNKEKVAIVLKITGLETLSPRMKASLLEVGQTITSWPQLASGVFLGGASVAHFARRLLLGENLPSGRFYIDFDEIIPIQQENSFDIKSLSESSSNDQSGFLQMIPDDILQSPYSIDLTQLKQLIEVANLAPSGGNIQPWIWVFDRKGNLHLFHDQIRSESLLDYNGTGSLVAFGAALENIRLFASSIGLEIEILEHIHSFGEKLIASVRFLTKLNQPILVPHIDLVDGIALRCTNRKNASRTLISQGQLSGYVKFAKEEGLELTFVQEKDDLEKLAKVVGGMDRMRFFHERGIEDFVKEVRWSEKEAIDTKDGIDIDTLELSGTEKAAMGLLKDPRTVKFFRKFFLGFGLTKISKETMTTASAVGLLTGSSFDPRTYLKAGRSLQRIWIKSNLDRVSFQPVTAMCFIFQLIRNERETGFSNLELAEIKGFDETTMKVFGLEKQSQPLFMFRLNIAGDPSVRSYRRDVEDTLIFV